MSHVVQIQTRVQDPAALTAACCRLGLSEPIQGAAQRRSNWPAGSTPRLAISRCDRHPDWYDQVRQLRGPLGRSNTSRSAPPDVRCREGEAGGAEEGTLRQRTSYPGW